MKNIQKIPINIAMFKMREKEKLAVDHIRSVQRCVINERINSTGLVLNAVEHIATS